MAIRHNRIGQVTVVANRDMNTFEESDYCVRPIGLEDFMITVRKFIDTHKVTEATIPLLIDIFDEYNKVLFHKVSGEYKPKMDVGTVMERLVPVLKVMGEDLRRGANGKIGGY